MMKRESDSKDITWFRSDRFFVVDGNWYFTTREGTNEGPFKSAQDAKRELIAYLMDKGIDPVTAEPWDTPGASN